MEGSSEAKNEAPRTLNVREEERGTEAKDKGRLQINQTVNSLGKQVKYWIHYCWSCDWSVEGKAEDH